MSTPVVIQFTAYIVVTVHDTDVNIINGENR